MARINRKYAAIALATIVAPLGAYVVGVVMYLAEIYRNAGTIFPEAYLGGIYAEPALLAAYPAVVLVGIPLYLLFDLIEVRSILLAAAVGAIVGLLVTALALPGDYFMPHGFLSGAVVGSVFQFIARQGVASDLGS